MNILLMAHSLVRWLIVVVALAAIVKFVFGLIRRSDYDRLSNSLASGFAGLMDLQALLGLIFFFWSGLAQGNFSMMRIEHAITMIVAVAVAHLPARWKSDEPAVRYRAGLAAIVVSLALIVAGVNVVGGWAL